MPFAGYGLLVRLGETQANIPPRDWPRLVRELRQNYCAICAQEHADDWIFSLTHWQILCRHWWTPHVPRWG